MSRTRKLLGPPGTGKTTTALKAVDEKLQGGTSPREIAYTSFTRKAAHEAIDRAEDQFGFTKDDFPFFGTLHSLAFRLLGLTPDQVMSKKHLVELGEKLGPYQFAGTYDEHTERGNPEGELGDVCMFIYQLSRSMLVSPEQAWRAVQDHPTRFGPPRTGPLPFHVVDYFIRGLEQYKRQHYLLDFSDFLDQCTTVLDPIELFILDEAQDLTPQQWRFARQLGRKAREVMVAGDDDQALYGWAGADVETLICLAGRNEVLPISHRLPTEVHAFVSRCASMIKRRLPKPYAPRSEKGSVRVINDECEVDLGSGEWLLLARTNWLTARLVSAARRAGVVYEIGGMWSNEDPTVQAILAYERLRKGERVLYSMAQLAGKYSQGYIPIRQEYVTWDDVIWPFEGHPDWMDALHHMGIEQREYIRACLKNGESLTRPGRVRISTIHQSKGGEGDNVLVLGDMGRRVENNFWADMDAELRVWYVAMSRARHNLFMVQPRTQTPLQPLFCR